MEEAEAEVCDGNYARALEIYERIIKSWRAEEVDSVPQVVLIGKANCLALTGRLQDSLKILLEAFQSGEVFPKQLHTFVKALVEFFRSSPVANSPPDAKHVSFSCVSCLGIPLDPVTITCGHTYCKACADKITQGHLCDECNEEISRSGASSCKVNVVLQSFLQKHFTRELEAYRVRLLGNELFRKKNTEGALEKYQQAILLCPNDHLVHGNISHVLCLCGKFEQALKSAESACRLRPHWPKGYYRKACALIGLGRKGDAVVAFAQCMAKQTQENLDVRGALVKVLHELLCSVRPRPGTGNHEAMAGDSMEFLGILDIMPDVQGSQVEEKNPSSGADHVEEIVEPLLGRLKTNSDLSSDDFECSLCCRLFYQPVTTPCGHTFCRTCLNRNLDHRPYCPICRFQLNQYLAERKQSVTAAIDVSIQELFPSEYVDRKQQHDSEMEQLASVAGDTDDEIPVFVCAVAWPGLPLPLHVFEPRYRLMIRQCMESGSRQFGMCAACDQNGFAEHGVMLKIRQVDYLPDGRSYVDTIGGRRFKVLNRGMRDGYHTAKVVWIKDEPIPADEIESVRQLHDAAYNECLRFFHAFPFRIQRQITDTAGEMPALESDPLNLPHGPGWVWWMAAICPIPVESMLLILATNSLRARILLLQDILATFPRFY